jgi:hypothetical protein
MADTSPKKKVAAKPQKPAAHPKYSEMVGKAIAALKERGGSLAAGFFLGLTTSPILNEPEAPVPFDCFKLF